MIKRVNVYLLATMIVFFGKSALAHSDGHASIKDSALKAAQHFTQVDVGLGFGTLAESWGHLNRKSVEIVEETSEYFIARVANTSEEKDLYILISKKGEIFDANFTGEFPKLKT